MTVRPRLAPLLVGLAVLAAGCGGAVATAPPAAAPTPAAATPGDGTGAGAPPAGTTAPAGAGTPVPPPPGPLAATPPPVVCAGRAPTPANAEGPYFATGSPERSDLREPGMPGTPLVVVGHVVDASCDPVGGARIEVWQADAAGEYDNVGYRLRGHLFSAPDGSYRFATIVPGQYPGRTEHIHVTVTPPGGSTLTTQLYFPGSDANAGDGIYDPSLLLDVAATPDGLLGTFTFVLPSP